MTSPTHSTTCPDQTKGRRRRLALTAAGVAGVSMVTTGAFASWNASTTASSGALNAANGTVAMVDANGGTFNSAVANLLPGDYFYRYVNLTNDGSATAPFAGTLAGTGDLGAHLSAAVDTCSVPWTSTAGASSCTGTTTPLLASTSIASPANITYGTIASVQYVRYTFTFSTGAPATMQGKAGVITATVNTALVGGRNRTTS